MKYLLSVLSGILWFLLLLYPSDSFADDWMVRMSHSDYLPSRLNLKVGDTVRWLNDDLVAHELLFTGNPTDTADDNLYIFIDKGKEASAAISKPGSYPYKCRWHGMFGVLKVSSGDK